MLDINFTVSYSYESGGSRYAFRGKVSFDLPMNPACPTDREGVVVLSMIPCLASEGTRIWDYHLSDIYEDEDLGGYPSHRNFSKTFCSNISWVELNARIEDEIEKVVQELRQVVARNTKALQNLPENRVIRQTIG